MKVGLEMIYLRILITIILLVTIGVSAYLLKDAIIMADFLTQLVVGIVLIIPFILIWGFKPIIERMHGDSEFRQKQKITHSKEILYKIFEHLCSIQVSGNDELVLSIPLPLDEYYKAQNITDITIHDYIPVNLDECLKSFENQEPEKYAFVPIKDNPVNVNWGLSHLDHKEYSQILSNYKFAENNLKLWTSTYKEHQITINKLIQNKIISPFLSNPKIIVEIKDQITFLINNAIMMNYSLRQKQITDVCNTSKHEIDSKKLYDVALIILKDNEVISQREKIGNLYREMDKALIQFKTELKKLVSETRDGVLVKGECKGCS